MRETCAKHDAASLPYRPIIEALDLTPAATVEE